MTSDQGRKQSFYSLRSWIIIYFSALFAASFIILKTVDIFGVPFTTFTGEYGKAREREFQNLNQVADIKKDAIQSWIAERKGDAKTLAYTLPLGELETAIGLFHSSVASGLTDGALRAAMESNPAYLKILRRFEAMRIYGVYEDIELAGKKTGRILVSLNQTLIGLDVSKREHFTETILTGKEETIHAEKDPATDRADILFCVPVKLKGEIVADLTLRVSLEKTVKRLLLTGSGIEFAGEILLVNQDAIALTPLDHIPTGMVSPVKPLSYKINAPPAQLASQGKKGIIETTDYRGVPVIAAFRFIPVGEKYGWGLVVKRDRDKVLAPIWSGLAYTTTLSLVCLVLTLMMTLKLADKLARPVRIVSETAGKIEAGDLSARAPFTAYGEINALAKAFNAMAGRVQNWRSELEAEVASRTRELENEMKERKLAMDKLAESERRFRETLENIDLIAVQLDCAGAITFANNFLLNLTGWKHEEIVGRNWFDLFLPPETRQDVSDVFAVTMKGDPIYIHYVNPIVTKDGKRRSVSWNNTLIRSVDGSVTGVTSIGEDITEKEIIEKERESLIAELGAKNAELEMFTYTVSHDLKSPLITIKGFTGQIERDIMAGNQERLRGDLNRIIAATDTMQRLLSELLELSRIGRLVNPPVNLSMTNLAEKTREMLNASIAERGVQVAIAPDMPDVWGDYPRLLEVMQNLMDNAVKFMGDQPSPVIEIGVRKIGGESEFFVKDNGIGIDKKYHNKIFGLFDKLDKKTEGTGIGLALVKKIVEAHGGRIWVESAGWGAGSTFFFTIPEKDRVA